MINDMYLNLAKEVYEKGVWDKETFKRKVTIYAQTQNMDMDKINDFIKGVLNEKEYTVEEKRTFLANIKLNNTELKYGNVLSYFDDEMIEKIYAEEVKNMTEEEIVEIHKETDHEMELQEIRRQESERQKFVVLPGGIRMPLYDDSRNELIEPENVEEEEKEEPEMPETEEEFEEQAQNITKPEKESTVRKVIASPERIEKLKKGKGKVLNFFLKTGIVVASVLLLNPVYSIPMIGGYLYFASEIKNGKYNPTRPIGQAIKNTVEKIMYIGMSKEAKEEERGKTR